MDVHARERLIGALILVGLVVLLVPAILKGRTPTPVAGPEPEEQGIVMEVEPEPAAPQDDVLVPEPVPAPGPAVGIEKPEKGAVVGAGETQAAEPAPVPPARTLAAGGDAEAPAWAVQLGAFSNRGKADALVADLRKRGYAAFVLEYRAGGKVLYRVRVGPEQDRARAQEIASRLGKDGFQPVVARHP